MHWITEEKILEAKKIVADKTIFSQPQIRLLLDIINKISEAIENEGECSKGKGNTVEPTKHKSDQDKDQSENKYFKDFT